MGQGAPEITVCEHSPPCNLDIQVKGLSYKNVSICEHGANNSECKTVTLSLTVYGRSDSACLGCE